ncbi:hypothetical protein SAMN06295905_1319 [Devosia lucknowensis]|uniref:Holin of 3TMs, for gene-transfer release n=1 Tax=Devosia lucknowensis TaxID=1096929 RepID=A0A1Y6ESU1_9HYPH|nr:hypothetical protein [Devosia lucknowensis]SMQ65798.1 hypothetical protein SAMN06295905_1319 [Devosia lucknowensis]
MLRTILDWLGGGVLRQFTGPLLQAYEAKLRADNDADRLTAEQAATRIEAARDIALAEAGRAWSATSVGRWLIVVPFGLWWAAIYLVQIVNPWFGLDLVVVDVPAKIHDMALVLVPAIVIADAGTFAIRRLRA